MYVCVDATLLDFVIAIIALHSFLPFLYIIVMNNQDRQTALHVAAERGFTEIIKLLLGKGANIEALGGYVSHHSCIL